MLILPSVLPDEFVLGYWGRIHLLNLRRTPQLTAAALIDYFSLQNSEIRRVAALAAAAKLSVQDFVQSHTLIPAQFAINQHFVGMAHGAPEFPKVIGLSWARLQKPGAYFCEDCASVQRETWGISYWRRSHQLIGVDWCPEHGCGLVKAPENSFFSCLPSRCSIESSSLDLVSSEGVSPVLERYAHVILGFFTRKCRLGLSDAARELRRLAAQKDITTNRQITGLYLSDVALDCLPTSWLASLFPTIGEKKRGSPFHPLDNTVLSGFAVSHAYALAMAVLHDSGEEALASLPEG